MIVVDTNIIAYLYLPCEFTAHAEQLLLTQPNWAAPFLWRSEFRNILAGYLRRGILSCQQALAAQREAEALMAGFEFDVPSTRVLELVSASPCSAHDCEFVALALEQNIPLFTQDKKILLSFPDVARSLVG